jgi:hypothetical protein
MRELIDQIDAILASYSAEKANQSDGLRGYLQGLRQVRHLAENLINKEL